MKTSSPIELPNCFIRHWQAISSSLVQDWKEAGHSYNKFQCNRLSYSPNISIFSLIHSQDKAGSFYLAIIASNGSSHREHNDIKRFT